MKRIYVFTNTRERAPPESTTTSFSSSESLPPLSPRSPTVTLLLKRPFPYCFFGKYRGTFVVITLQRVRDNSAPRIIEVYMSREESEVLRVASLSLLPLPPLPSPSSLSLSIDLLEISFDTPRAGRARSRERHLPVQRARTDEHNHRLSPRSEELRHHIVVARVSAATSALP